MDGYDDINLFQGDISESLPVCGHGHIIVTSRDRTVATHLHGDLIDIHELEKELGLELLLKGDLIHLPDTLIKRNKQTLTNYPKASTKRLTI